MRVLIVYTTAGGGHHSVALAISAALRELAGPAIEVDLLDVYSASCSRMPATAFPGVYGRMVRHAPWAFRVFYRSLEGRRRFGMCERLMEGSFGSRLRRELAVRRPDVVVRVLPGIGWIMSRALRAAGGTDRVVTVLTDLVTVHPGWVTGSSTAYAVPTPAAAAACRTLGVPPSSIHCLGLPIGAAFVARPGEPDRRSLRHRLGLDPAAPTVLLMGGGEGGGRLEATARALGVARPDAQLVVVAGRNAALRRRLFSRPPLARCTFLSLVPNDEVADWMRAADLLVTKAGPSTVVEAMHVGLPTLLTGSLPQEEGTVDYLVEHGATELAFDPVAAGAAARRLLTDPDRLAALRARGLALCRPSAARDTAGLVLTVARG